MLAVLFQKQILGQYYFALLHVFVGYYLLIGRLMGGAPMLEHNKVPSRVPFPWRQCDAVSSRLAIFNQYDSEYIKSLFIMAGSDAETKAQCVE